MQSRIQKFVAARCIPRHKTSLNSPSPGRLRNSCHATVTVCEDRLATRMESGSAYGSRTRVPALRGPCPRPLDERAVKCRKACGRTGAYLLVSRNPELCLFVRTPVNSSSRRSLAALIGSPQGIVFVILRLDALLLEPVQRRLPAEFDLTFQRSVELQHSPVKPRVIFPERVAFLRVGVCRLRPRPLFLHRWIVQRARFDLTKSDASLQLGFTGRGLRFREIRRGRNIRA